ncbi:MAG: hypothetical protein ABI846_06410 [Rudaea sp.]
MNAATVLSITGATIDRRQRALALTFWVAATALALVFARTRELVVPMIAYSVGMGFWWTYVAGRALLLQRDARVLRLPDVDAVVVANLLSQWVFTALLPAVILTVAAQTEFLRVAALFSCIAAGALMFQVLPSVLAALFSIVPAAMQFLNARGLIPGLNDPGFIPFGWSLAAAMLVVALWRWRRIIGADAYSFGGWSVPLVIQLQLQSRSRVCGGAEAIAVGASARDGLHRQVRLSGIGARTPVHALRVWLGGAFAPVGWRQRAVQGAFVLSPMLMPVLLQWLTSSTIAGWIVFAIVAVGTIVPLVTMSVASARLLRLYSDPGGELSLLALLPGIDAATAKRSLVRAILGLPLSACAGLYAFAMLACLGAGGGGRLMLALTLSTAGAVGFGIVHSLTVIAGKAIPRPALHAASLLGITLLCTTPALLPLRDTAAIDRVADLVLLGWALLYILIAGLGIRAARALARRPQVFLLHDH